MKKQWMMTALVLACMLTVTACTNKSAGSSDTSSMEMQDEMQMQGETMKDAGYKKITADEAQMMMTDDVVVLDVRTEDEFAQGHIQNAVLLPQTDISEKAEMILGDKDQTILIYCRTGNRSETAAKQLIDMGYANVYDFGGIDTWTGELVTDESMNQSKDMMDESDMEKDMMKKSDKTEASMNQ